MIAVHSMILFKSQLQLVTQSLERPLSPVDS